MTTALDKFHQHMEAGKALAEELRRQRNELTHRIIRYRRDIEQTEELIEQTERAIEALSLSTVADVLES